MKLFPVVFFKAGKIDIALLCPGHGERFISGVFLNKPQYFPVLFYGKFIHRIEVRVVSYSSTFCLENAEEASRATKFLCTEPCKCNCQLIHMNDRI